MSSKLKMSTGGLKRPYYPLKRSFPALRIYIYKFVLPYHPRLLHLVYISQVPRRACMGARVLLEGSGVRPQDFSACSIQGPQAVIRGGRVLPRDDKEERIYIYICGVLERIFSRDNMVSLIPLLTF